MDKAEKEMQVMRNRIRQMIFKFEDEISNLRIERKSYGYEVQYENWAGAQEITVYERNGKNKTYKVYWLPHCFGVTDGLRRTRLPKYDRHFIG